MNSDGLNKEKERKLFRMLSKSLDLWGETDDYTQWTQYQLFKIDCILNNFLFCFLYGLRLCYMCNAASHSSTIYRVP